MKTNESNLWRWFKNGVLEGIQPNDRKTCGAILLSGLHWQRIENKAKTGTLDVEGCYTGTSFVIELKSLGNAKSFRIWPKSRPHQAIFLNSRYLAGGRSFLLIEIDGKRRYLIRGKHAASLFDVRVTEEQLAALSVTRRDAPAVRIFAAVINEPL